MKCKHCGFGVDSGYICKSNYITLDALVQPLEQFSVEVPVNQFVIGIADEEDAQTFVENWRRMLPAQRKAVFCRHEVEDETDTN